MFEEDLEDYLDEEELSNEALAAIRAIESILEMIDKEEAEYVLDAVILNRTEGFLK